jgi:flavin-dependent thymidylate synthase
MPFAPEPEVVLCNALKDPYNTIVAAARTCYSGRVVTPEDVDKDDKSRATRDRIYDSIYQAGHHTTIQHPTFQFVLRRVSRQFLWSFLHAHPYYNSEQVSQRYVEVKPQNFATPPMSDASREVFRGAVGEMMDAYFALMEILLPDVEREYYKIYPARKREPAKWESAIHKRVMEAARYVLPVATHAHLYHTISGLTLHRYHRLSRQFDTPAETRDVVEKMVAEVRKLDPLFFRAIEDPVPLEETLEHRLFEEQRRRPAPDGAFAREFDAELGPWRSKLVDWKANGPAVMAQSVRSVLGRAREGLADGAAIGLVLDPAKNPVLSESLVLTEMSKLSRAMHHPHYTFRKKLSHTADSQDQRHRMVPGTRPILAAQVGSDRPDVVLPPVMESNGAARAKVEALFARVWKAVGRIAENEGGLESAHYLLPNAVAVRFEESGDLLNLHHKWTTRLCYLAQEEIWRCCREEVEQVEKVHPEFAGFLRAPCTLRKGAGKSPYCPEGPRFCGVRVWELPLEKYVRAI